MTFKYILRGNGSKAIAIHSSLNWMEMAEYIRINSKKIHEDSNDVVFRLGGLELVNPQVMGKDEFVDFLPHLIMPE